VIEVLFVAASTAVLAVYMYIALLKRGKPSAKLVPLLLIPVLYIITSTAFTHSIYLVPRYVASYNTTTTLLVPRATTVTEPLDNTVATAVRTVTEAVVAVGTVYTTIYTTNPLASHLQAVSDMFAVLMLLTLVSVLITWLVRWFRW